MTSDDEITTPLINPVPASEGGIIAHFNPAMCKSQPFGLDPCEAGRQAFDAGIPKVPQGRAAPKSDGLLPTGDGENF